MIEMSKKKDGTRPLTKNDDGHFVLLCRKGDADAFEVLVERYQKRMFNVAYRMTGDYEEACEVVQEAFLSAYKAIRKFRGEATFATWLTGITMNHAKNRLKQMNARSRYEGPSIDDPVETETGILNHEVPSPEIPVLEQLEQKEIQAKVQECVNSLDNEYREVLVLRDIQGFSYDEIRDILKIPDGTVKSRLFRAREAMKICLKKVLGDL
ncbi:MAG: sigma-70 family RNA polymerase sigma factor [Syntrophorhabdus aromaticivorans]|uniref:Sigma-70 family RNA polymerase sigma factor n=2 Tax=Syntrophorhabdus aromaticivorans TaxID=328301 RepID=A0A971M1Z4_9BACT|nr:sigma-70 family RNA polymerase sigma factor [Syntrophorhabdus aromaticivorans]